MKVSEAFPSKYLKASDLPEGKVSAITIEDATLEEIGQGEKKSEKIVIAIVGKDKSFVVNKTNANSISKLYGDETDDWIGKSIGLFRTEVQFGVDMVESIRVHNKVPKSAPAQSVKTTKAKTEIEEVEGEEEPDQPW